MKENQTVQRRIRKKILLLVVLAILPMHMFIPAGVIFINWVNSGKNMDQMLKTIAEEYQNPKKETKEATKEATKEETKNPLGNIFFFTIENSESQETVQINLEHISYVSETEAQTYLQEALKQEKTFGYIENYRYYVKQSEKGTVFAVFLLCDRMQQTNRRLLSISVSVSCFSFLCVCVAAWFLSDRLSRSIQNLWNRQTEFVSNASHELKTPMGIISAIIDIEQMEQGEKPTMKAVQKQIGRMNGLISAVLDLARLDEGSIKTACEACCLTELVQELFEAYQMAAEVQDKTMVLESVQGLWSMTEADDLRRLLSILLDNAVKYGIREVPIEVQLQRNRKEAVISVSNGCKELDPTKIPHFFDRFYRGNTAQEAASGYGIGLAMAKSISENHGWKLWAEAKTTTAIRFCLQIRLRKPGREILQKDYK